ncbi:thioredoxin family protein [Catenulispora sp. GP43]|uniref:thioredoxin family protein n=1 Tax=Catenulispora sp. GP43 TaxID=3156263 RepID=UPI0035186BA8
MASTAFGLAACSSPDQHREPAGAARPLSAPASQAVVRAEKVHAAPAVPAASGAQPGQAALRHGAAAGVAEPVLIPSGTTDVAPQPAHPRAAERHPVAAAPAPVPAAPRPAPAPPATDSPMYDPNASVTAQIVDAVAAARMDGKAVLLDFGANWCTACRALERAMQTPKVQAVLAQSYHVVHIDLGNADPQHLAMATQFDPMGTFGMPLLVVLNSDGTFRADSAHTGQPKYTEADMAAWLGQWVR